MKIVVAMDSFKGTLTAVNACAIVAETLKSLAPEVEIVARPMADGGEGTAAALMAAADGQWVGSRVTGPLPEMQVDAGFVWLPGDGAAVVEMASASGLELLTRRQRNPLCATTCGTGQLIAAALRHGAQRILLALGGSATVDGGVGAAMALGWRFLAGDGQPIAPGGGQIGRIAQIIPPAQGLNVPVDVLCDVDSPLWGPHGAARVYGPQKGATSEMVETLDAALAHLAQCVRDQLGVDVSEMPGAGAAGGLAAGAVAFMGARLVSGAEVVMDQVRLRQAVTDAEWVITGEGCFDHQSLRGKAVSGVARVAREGGAKVAVLAGQVRLPPQIYRTFGVEAAVGCVQGATTLGYALKHSEELLAQAAAELARTHLAL
jgi:glycerate kinase